MAPDGPDASVSGNPTRINNFGYADDPLGLKCPVGAHIRRSNPRDAPASSGGGCPIATGSCAAGAPTDHRFRPA